MCAMKCSVCRAYKGLTFRALFCPLSSARAPPLIRFFCLPRRKMPTPKPPSQKRTGSSRPFKSSHPSGKSRRRQNGERSVFADTSAPYGTSALGFPKFFRGGAVPPRKMVILPYSSNKTLTAGSASSFGSEYVFRLNSIYDPDYSGAGDYPNGYSAWSNFYADYRVHRVVIDLAFTDPSSDGMAVAALLQYSNATSGLAGSSIQTVDSQDRKSVV